MEQPPILRLPHELLVKVLSFVVGKRPPGVCLWNHGPDGTQWCGPRRMPTDRYTAMMSVCRAFYYAGIEAYYGGVIFKFLSVDHLRAVLSSLGQDRKRCIKRIVVNVEFENKSNAQNDTSKSFYFTRSTWDLETDPLAELPSLQEAKINLGVVSAGDRTTAAKEIDQLLRAAWPSKAEAVQIEWFWRDY